MVRENAKAAGVNVDTDRKFWAAYNQGHNSTNTLKGNYGAMDSKNAYTAKHWSENVNKVQDLLNNPPVPETLPKPIPTKVAEQPKSIGEMLAPSYLNKETGLPIVETTPIPTLLSKLKSAIGMAPELPVNRYGLPTMQPPVENKQYITETPNPKRK